MAEIASFFTQFYGGLPLWALPIYLIALLFIICSFISLLVLTVRARGYRRHENKERRRVLHEDDFLWIFMVPALNEEVTIADSVSRLADVRVTHKRILVVNDGSNDRTGEILDGLDVPELTVLTRVAPHARQGKSEALNDAWRHVHATILASGPYAGWQTRRVVIVIVDADGRLEADVSPIATALTSERVGGVQSLVRIYNRHGFLSWAQDLEFGVFGALYQSGRAGWGTANMGGNGQFNRLSALDDVVVEDAWGRRGPWRSGRLTEDQDIGLRLIQKGWRGAQSTSVTIHQQGLNSLRALYRQRTRWAQGGWQVLDELGRAPRSPGLPFAARCDQLWYLLTPVVQAWVGISVVLSVIFLATGVALPEWNVAALIAFYIFSAAPGIIGVLMARKSRGVVSTIGDILLAHLYLIYSWIIYPVVYRALLRQAIGARTWAKTSREAIVSNDENTATPGLTE